MKYLTIVAFTLCISCSEMGKKESSSISRDANSLSNGNIQTDSFNLKFSFLRNLPVRNTPFRDSTNFDNFRFSALLSQEQLYRFNLAAIVSPYDLKDIRSSEMRYRIPLSEQFVTVVFTTQVGEHELRTDLANFDHNFRLIDFKTIAYDDIAEGCIQKAALISKDKIIIYEANYCDADTAILEKNWILDGAGMVILAK
ncbi:MAG: hypothetical protein IPM92_04230 [Saprospiraceae bacterium]|nr:hypothetical protein [Saprospiraceae bacterium]